MALSSLPPLHMAIPGVVMCFLFTCKVRCMHILCHLCCPSNLRELDFAETSFLPTFLTVLNRVAILTSTTPKQPSLHPPSCARVNHVCGCICLRPFPSWAHAMTTLANNSVKCYKIDTVTHHILSPLNSDDPCSQAVAELGRDKPTLQKFRNLLISLDIDGLSSSGFLCFRYLNGPSSWGLWTLSQNFQKQF